MATVILWKTLFLYLYQKKKILQCYLQRTWRTVPKIQPDFVKLAESYEAYGMRIEKEEDIKKAFEFAKEHTDASTILEFMIDSDELVLPMVQGGQALDCMILDC